VGISQKNIDKIFNFGYTTKENGHGFGLHSCALLARELGGSLTVESEGQEHGANFTLEIPDIPNQ
jgi:sensor histidine kinase regulating citrate/malate metabolism